MFGEEWRACTGFEAQYRVSNLGRVRSLDRLIRTAFGATKLHRGRVLTSCLDKDGYPKVVLRVDGKHHTRYVHRLVAEAFHGAKQNALHSQVDHIDANRSNARADNLRWVSLGENHYLRRGTKRDGKTAISPLTAEQVREIRAAPQEHGVVANLARRFGVPYWAVYDARRYKTWRYA